MHQTLRVIIAAVLLLVPCVLSSERNGVESCDWFKNATYSKDTQISEDTLRAMVLDEMARFPARYHECPATLARHACFQVYSREKGILDVDPKYYFPDISFNRRTAIVGNTPKQQTSPSGSRIAYILLIHQNADQAKRLLQSIHHPDNLYVFHADTKLPEDQYNRLVDIAKGYENVVLTTTRFNVVWGGIEMVHATLEGLFTALEYGEWDHILNLSGADYPLCTDLEFKSKLTSGSNYDSAYRLKDDDFRAEHVCMGCLDLFNHHSYFTGIKRPVMEGFSLYGSSQWFIYSRGFVEWIRSAPLTRILLAYMESTCIPDEEYFATLLMNSPFATTNIRNNMRHISFDGDHPFVLHTKDFPTLKASKSCFARKFDADDIEILDLLDSWRYNKTHM